MKLDHTIARRRFQQLITLGPAFNLPVFRRRRMYVVARCDCGQIVVVRVDGLGSKDFGSCGCAQRESAVELGKARKGPASPTYKHGGKGTRLYSTWAGMLSRCRNPQAEGYHNYGGRGIKVCSAWYDFATFQAWALQNGYQEGLEIDRRRNSGHYSPGNCRFVETKVNARNTRSNRRLRLFGETKCVVEWAEDPRAAATAVTIYKRLENGWSPKKAVTHPTQKRVRQS